MDKALLRPLFRQTAIHAEQIRTGNIPQYFLGAAVGWGARLGTSAMKGYRTMRGIRAARTAAGAPMGFQRAVQGAKPTYEAGKRFMARPGAQKGLLGLEVAGVGAGGEEIRRAAMDKESLLGGGPATYTGGIAMMYPGAVFGGRTFPKAFPKIAGTATSAKVASKLAKGPAPFLLPLGFGASSMVEKGAYQEIKDEEKYRIKPEVLKNFQKKFEDIGGDNSTREDRIQLVESFNFTNEQKARAYDALGLPDKVEETISIMQGSEVATQPAAPTDKVEEVPQNIQGENESIAPANVVDEAEIPPEALQDEEQKVKGKAIMNAKKAAGKEVEKFTLSARGKEIAREFADLKGAITSVTGGGDNANLLLLKMASGLMTGKSTKSGLAGLMDITGQAMEPTIDTAIALGSQQKEYDNNLAMVVVKNMQEKEQLLLEAQLEGAGGMKILPDRQYVRVKTDDFLGADTLEVGIDDDSGRRVLITPGKGGEGFSYFEGEGTATKPDTKRQATYNASMQNAAIGIQMARFVRAASPAVLGPNASIVQFQDNLSGALSSIGGYFEGGDIQSIETYNKIVADTRRNVIGDEEGLSQDELDDRSKEAEELVKEFVDKEEKLSKAYQGALDVGDAKRLALARLGYIENRMAYLVANTYKPEDRLTIKDIEIAERNTKIIKYWTNPRRVQDNYKIIEEDMNTHFVRNAKAYVNIGGGSASFIYSNYQSIPVVRRNYIKNKEREGRGAETPQDVLNYEQILESIQ